MTEMLWSDPGERKEDGMRQRSHQRVSDPRRKAPCQADSQASEVLECRSGQM